MKPNSHQYKAFVYAVREGSITSAAKRMGVTQSAVTQHIAKLEKAVGTNLLIRSAGVMSLTNAGGEVFALADKLVDYDTLLSEKINGYAKIESGKITVIANAPRPAMALLQKFSRLFPGVEVDFSLFDWTTSMRLIRNRQADIAVITNPTEHSGLTYERVVQAKYKAILPSEHHMAMYPEISLDIFREIPLLLTEEGSLTTQVVREKLIEHKITCSRTMRLTSYTLLKEAVLHGLGIGVFLEDSSYPTSALVEKPITQMPETFETKLVIPSEKRDLRLVSSFMESMQVGL